MKTYQPEKTNEHNSSCGASGREVLTAKAHQKTPEVIACYFFQVFACYVFSCWYRDTLSTYDQLLWWIHLLCIKLKTPFFPQYRLTAPQIPSSSLMQLLADFTPIKKDEGMGYMDIFRRNIVTANGAIEKDDGMGYIDIRKKAGDHERCFYING